MLYLARTKSALQLKFIPPTFNEKGFLEKEGAILFEGANGENKEYNWAKDAKVSFACSTNDLPHMYEQFQGFVRNGKIDLKLLHDPNAGTDNKGKTVKIFSISSMLNKDQKLIYFINLNEKTGKEEKKVSVIASVGELL